MLTPVKAKKTSKEGSIWYIDTPDNTSKKYNLIVAELKEEFKKRNIKEVMDLNKDMGKEPKNIRNFSKEKNTKDKPSGRAK
ncbi:hypothetical protein NOVO_05425 [Rickettsiales bacterium Ac37b]|nr:hypothetical protein NOVO_05425 [Rickettsiales bacterium Ac37b]